MKWLKNEVILFKNSCDPEADGQCSGDYTAVFYLFPAYQWPWAHQHCAK
jgi:hypothetical protein